MFLINSVLLTTTQFVQVKGPYMAKLEATSSHLGEYVLADEINYAYIIYSLANILYSLAKLRSAPQARKKNEILDCFPFENIPESVFFRRLRRTKNGLSLT